MAISLSPLVLMLVCARNFPMALAHAPVRAAIAPRIARNQRATYLSLHGLSERLFFALLLLVLSAELEPGAPADQSTLSAILGSTVWIGLVSMLLLFAFAGRIRRQARVSEAEP